MNERSGVVTFKGAPMTLIGEELSLEQNAPDFTLVGNGLNPVQFSEFAGKVLLLSSVVSLDTPV